MKAPTKFITHNSSDEVNGAHQRNPSWVVCILSFEEPAAMRSKEKTSTPIVKPILVIENDCLNINISNSKSSFGKLASLSIKPTNLWYPGRVSPGDWMFVWMVDSQEKADLISKTLYGMKTSNIGNALCDQNSGLKFAGRVLNVSTNDTTTNNSRTVVQSITGQSFLEFATSVYYTYAGQAAAATLNPNQLGGGPVDPAYVPSITQTFMKFGQSDVLGAIADKFLEVYNTGIDHAPDTLIGLYYSFIMGVNADKAKIAPELYNKPVTGHLEIKIPKEVATILGSPNSVYLWELINANLGMQQYSGNGMNWYERFQPDFDTDFQTNVISVVNGVAEIKGLGPIKRTKTRTEGFIPYRPAIWDNQSMWSIFEQYLNPVVNEMYTALRINKEGRIVPTFVVREKPLSTGLFNVLKHDGTVDTSISTTQTSGSSTAVSLTSSAQSTLLAAAALSPIPMPLDKPSPSDFEIAVEETTKKEVVQAQTSLAANNRTLYGTLPRWHIDKSMIKSYSFSTSESNRINYVQVWGTSAATEYISKRSPQSFKQYQFDLGNSFYDNSDITRNGLRAHIVTSNCDIDLGEEAGSFANLWAKKNADWLFNGHLKANASVTLIGIVDPICEGDNCLIGNILYHIESVSHVGVLSGGKKQFDTTLSLSNGMLATSFEGDNIKKIPHYPIDQGSFRGIGNGPGHTETQLHTGDTAEELLSLKGIAELF